MSQIDVLQIALNPILYTAYFWATTAAAMVAACIVSKTIDAIQSDWEQIQRHKTRQYIAATPYRDLRRISQQYGLKPITQNKVDLVAAIYNYHQQQQRYLAL